MAEEQSPTDHEAFLRLFTRSEGNLRAFVASLLPTREGVDDVMQESSVVLWRKFSEFDQSGADSDFLGWAFMIARYEVLKYRRRRATDRLQFSEDVFELLASEAERACAGQIERQLALHECVKELEPKQLAIVKAAYEDGAAIKDVAEQIGRSPTGLYKALARIRNRLALCPGQTRCKGGGAGMKFPFECDIDLVNGYCSGILTDHEFSELERRLRESPELRQMLIEYRSIESALPSAIASGSMEKAEASATKKNRAIRRLKITLLATAAGLILMFGLYFLRPANEQQIATVASMTGSVRWTGAGGQVDDDVQSGRALTGGTIECLSVDSSAAFEFRDGTTVTISGLSVLTISDNGQKELHLREGNFTAVVETQPEGKPLRVLTAAAELEVRGTQFDVIAAERQTKIIVNKGLVRVTRVTDGSFVDVPAAHSLVTTIEAQEPLVATPVKEPVSVWKANLAKDKGEGDWFSAAHALRLEIGRAVEAGEVKQDEILQVYGDRLANTRDDEGILKAIPKPTGRREQPILYVVSLNISQRQSGPILMSKGSQLRIKGRAEKPNDVLFGFAARNRDRTVQDRFTASRRVESAFDIELPVAELQELGKGDDGASAVGLEVFAWFGWANEPGLEITHVELLAP